MYHYDPKTALFGVAVCDQRGLGIVDNGADEGRIKVGVGWDQVASFAVCASCAVARDESVIFLIDHGAIGQLAVDLDRDFGVKWLAGDERDEKAIDVSGHATVGVWGQVDDGRAGLSGTGLPEAQTGFPG